MGSDIHKIHYNVMKMGTVPSLYMDQSLRNKVGLINQAPSINQILIKYGKMETGKNGAWPHFIILLTGSFHFALTLPAIFLDRQ